MQWWIRPGPSRPWMIYRNIKSRGAKHNAYPSGSITHQSRVHGGDPSFGHATHFETSSPAANKVFERNPDVLVEHLTVAFWGVVVAHDTHRSDDLDAFGLGRDENDRLLLMGGWVGRVRLPPEQRQEEVRQWKVTDGIDEEKGISTNQPKSNLTPNTFARKHT